MYNFEQCKLLYKNGIELPKRTEENFRKYRIWYDNEGITVDVQFYEGKTIVYYMKNPEINSVENYPELVALSFPGLSWEDFITKVDIEQCIPAIDEGTLISYLTPGFSTNGRGYSITFLKEEDLKDKSLEEVQKVLFELYKKRRTTFLPFKWIE